MSNKPFAVVAGVGPGTGSSVARRFAKEYPVVLLARGEDKFTDLAKKINDEGGKAVGISADVSNAESLKSAFQQIEKEFPGAHCAAAVFNAAGGMVRKPFLEVTEKEFSSGWEVSQYVSWLQSTSLAAVYYANVRCTSERAAFSSHRMPYLSY